VGPAALPAEATADLARLFTEAMTDTQVRPILDQRGMEALPETGPDFVARIRRDRARWARVVAQSNIRAD